MAFQKIGIVLLTGLMFACQHDKKQSKINTSESEIHIVGAMKNVMWRGKLGSSIDLDTISNKTGLYGLGPVSYLKGELLINNGKSYVSEVASDSTMNVTETFNTAAPFFVFSNVTEWDTLKIPKTVTTISDLERFIKKNIPENSEKPFTFKLIGNIKSATIHIQNLPDGSTVTSPKEAHQGQVNYTITDQNCEIIGFFSKNHQGIFTHHDSFMHMHLISADEKYMGHVDALEIQSMTLYLSKNR